MLTTTAPHTCHLCCIVFSNLENLQEHEVIRHRYLDSDSQFCHFCHILFPDRPKFLDHMRDHELRQFMCDQCPKAFHTEAHLKKHKNTHLPNKIRCPFCPKTYKENFSLNQHIKYFHEKKLVECKVCHEKVKYLQTHMYHKHGAKRNLIHRCLVCNRDFGTRALLKAHQKAHDEGSKSEWQCEECGKMIPLSKLKSHRQSHRRSKLPKKTVICDTCGKTIAKTGITLHMAVHKKELNRFVCEQCGKRFSVLQRLEAHTVVHTKEKKHVCKACGKAYSQRCALSMHMKKVHSCIMKRK